jgi:hypothetical protein
MHRPRRKATQPRVETQYGKHFRLQVVDHVILVSDSGFTKTARAVAARLGYLAIHPNITKSELAEVLNERFAMSVKMTEINLVTANFTTAFVEGVTAAFRLATDGDEAMFIRSDGTNLVLAKDFELKAASEAFAKEGLKDPASLMASEAYERDFDVPTLVRPTHEGERLHVLLTDGTSEVVAPLETLDIKTLVSATDTAKGNLTNIGNFGGHPFASGQSQIGNSPANFVVVDTSGGAKMMFRFQYEAGKKAKPARKRAANKGSRGKNRK